MKSFFKKVVLFAFLIAAVNIVTEIILSNQGSNSYWGNELLTEKIDEQQANYEDCNFFFLGPSIFYRQIDPDLFDKTLGSSGVQSLSYNLSTVGMTPPEDLFVLERMLEKDIPSNSTVFLATTPIKGLSTNNLFKGRTCYYLNGKTLSLIFSEVNDSNHGLATKMYLYSSYLINYAYKVFSMGHLRSLLGSDIAEETIDLTETNRGYLALDDDRFESKTNRTKNFLKNTNELEQRRKNARSVFSNSINAKSSPHSDYLKTLVESAEKRNINLVFVLPPRLKNYSRTYHVHESLPVDNVINLADPEIFPEFYQIENSFDIGHLNKRGAKLFTEALAEEYLKIKNK